MNEWDESVEPSMVRLEECFASAFDPPVASGKPPTKATVLRQMCLDLGVVPFKAEDIGGLFVRYPVNRHCEIDRLRSSRFKAWMAAKYFESIGSEPKQADLEGALLLLGATAEFSEPRELYTRIGRAGGKIYVDLCNPEAQAVEIDAEGWRVVDDSPLWFLRSSMKALPMPQGGGSINDLRKFVNASDEDFILIVGWLLASLAPEVKYPILTISSEHGSGKSTLTNFLKELIDPDGTGGVAPFKDVDALCVTAASRHVVALDNLSRITGEDSDHLCRIATGVGMIRRQLYTDGETYESFLRKPMILNGIAFAPDRADLLDRCYPVSLLPLTTGRIAERDLKAAFAKARPSIFGALLDAVSTALRESDYKPSPKVRMIDAATFVIQAEKGGALPWVTGTFERVLLEMEQTKQSEAVTNNPVGRILLELAEKGGWDGLLTALWEQVRFRVDAEERLTLPKSARGFGAALTRLTPMLRGLGVMVQKAKNRFGVWVTLTKVEETEPTGGRPA